MPNIKQCVESQLKGVSNGTGVMSIRALCSPPKGYAPAPVSCPIWGMTGESGTIYNKYMKQSFFRWHNDKAKRTSPFTHDSMTI
jgi:hypothetical protein